MSLTIHAHIASGDDVCYFSNETMHGLGHIASLSIMTMRSLALALIVQATAIRVALDRLASNISHQKLLEHLFDYLWVYVFMQH